jgi:NADPH:quinone reductase-like Zn-dependent oxidoreductase
MKAVVYEKVNSPDVLVYREVEKPTPGDNDVLVKVVAVSANAADIRSMKMGIIPKRKIFGSDIAGRVEAVGKNIRQFAIGDEVFGDISGCGFGGFAEYVAVPETLLALKPAMVSFETAAAVPMSAVTALQALRNLGNIQPGQKVLICGSGGGVGTFSVQLAKYFGAVVTAVCGGKNARVAQSLGADHVIDYQRNDFAKGGMCYNIILAVNGNHSLSTYRRLLSSGGICVVVGGALSQVMKALLFGPLLSVGGKKMRVLSEKPNAKDLAFVIKLVEEGKVTPVIDRQYPLSKTAEAMRYLGGGHALGKVIIKVGE